MDVRCLPGHIRRDVRDAVRGLRTSPVFTAVAVLSIAIGVGATAGLFAIISAALLRPLPVPEPDRLMFVFSGTRESPHGPISHVDFRDLGGASRTFGGVAAYAEMAAGLRIHDGSEVVRALLVSGTFFGTLGVQPATGRLLAPADDRVPGAHPVVVLGYALWQRQFAGDPAVVGRDIAVNGRIFTVVGVTPAGFRGPEVLETYELYAPLMMEAVTSEARPGGMRGGRGDWLERRDARWLRVIARLGPGASLDQAQSDLDTIAARLALAHPATNRDRTMTAFPVEQIDPRAFGPLVTAAGFLLVLAVAVAVVAALNVSNLALVRALAREREVAIRLALGAGRIRLVSSCLAEGMLLGAAGGGLGVLGAAWLVAGFNAARPTAGIFELSLPFTLDTSVWAVALLVAAAGALLIAVMPLQQGGRTEIAGVLRDAARALDGVGTRVRFRRVLLAAQFGLSVVLLVAAGLFTRSLERAEAIDLGFDADRVLTVDLRLDLLPAQERPGPPFIHDLIDSVAAVPAVEAVTLARSVPLSGGGTGVPVAIAETPDPRGEVETMPVVSTNLVHVNYFTVLRIPIVRGRDFRAADVDGAPLVAIVNETFVRRFLAGEEPLGRRIRLGDEREAWSEVVGVVCDSKYRTVGEPPTPFAYQAFSQHRQEGMTLFARSARSPLELLPDIRRAIASVNREVPAANSQPLSARVDSALFPTRMAARIASGLALLATFLAAIGLFGVTAFVSARRSREIGIRMALGARRSDIVRAGLGETASVVGIGIAAGWIGAALVSRLIAGFLYGVNPLDPLTFAAVAVVLGAVMMGTAYVPVCRAARRDPLTVLRRE